MSWTQVRRVNQTLNDRHYLGSIGRGIAWEDEFGCMVLTNPTSRRLPMRWLEIARWCLHGEKNGGSRQWARVRRQIRVIRPDVTTVVSYSDPSAGHTGALYKACGFKWRPTWHRLRPPPSGNGNWGTRQESVKDRWVYEIAADAERDEILSVKDAAAARRDLELGGAMSGAGWAVSALGNRRPATAAATSALGFFARPALLDADGLTTDEDAP